MAFAKYERRQPRSKTGPWFGIRRDRIVLSYQAVRDIAKGRENVELYYDKDAREIMISFIDKPSKDSLKITGVGTKLIAASKFFKHFGIKVEPARIDNYSVVNNSVIIDL
jgi:hypothetical protein